MTTHARKAISRFDLQIHRHIGNADTARLPEESAEIERRIRGYARQAARRRPIIYAMRKESDES